MPQYKKFLIHLEKHNLGFTLVELLVVISILAVLSIIGFTVFTNIQNNAEDVAKKADVDAITKAYDLRYAKYGSYQNPTNPNSYALDPSDFSNGKVPDLTNSTIVRSTSKNGIRICTQLGNSTQSCDQTTDQNCYCKGTSLEQPPSDADISQNPNSVEYIHGNSSGGTSGTGSGSASPTPTPTPVPDNQDLWFGDITHYSTNDCNNLLLWVCDKDYPPGPITVKVYDGPKANNKLVATGQTTFLWGGTNAPTVCGTTARYTGFSIATPASLKDGQDHRLYYYGISLNTNGEPGSKGEVGGASEPFKCPR